jgi:hypothetical protein
MLKHGEAGPLSVAAAHGRGASYPEAYRVMRIEYVSLFGRSKQRVQLPNSPVVGNDPWFDVYDGCGAPEGARSWVSAVIEAVDRVPRFDPFGEVSQLKVGWAERDSTPDNELAAYLRTQHPHGDMLHWASRLCLLRYRHLANFYTLKPIEPKPPSEPRHRLLFDKWRKDEIMAERACNKADRSLWQLNEAIRLVKNPSMNRGGVGEATRICVTQSDI